MDLSASPDAETLLAAGRVLEAVDDVHLLSAYLLLKLGAVGVLWFVLLLAALWRVVGGLLTSAERPDATSLGLLLFVVAGVVDALPAATNLLSNPLVPLLLGVLWLRWGRAARWGEAT